MKKYSTEKLKFNQPKPITRSVSFVVPLEFFNRIDAACNHEDTPRRTYCMRAIEKALIVTEADIHGLDSDLDYSV